MVAIEEDPSDDEEEEMEEGETILSPGTAPSGGAGAGAERNVEGEADQEDSEDEDEEDGIKGISRRLNAHQSSMKLTQLREACMH